MFSSIIDDKPTASTWLDRLRLNRGIFTTEDDDASGNPLTLDDFLRRNNQTEITATSSASDSPPSAPIPSNPELAESPLEEDPNPGEWYGVMSDVLSELFNFDGGSSKSSGKKKLPRKQSNPKHCSLESSEDVVVPLVNQKSSEANCVPSVREFAASSSRSSYNKKPTAEIRERRRSVEEVDDEEEEKGEKDLVGFSRSEVTVIDTSFKVWKSEKLVFRRRNVWKVREKKGKSKVVSKIKKMMKKKKKKMKKKKRKCDDDGDDDGEIVRRSKKMKISTSVSDNVSTSLFPFDDEYGFDGVELVLGLLRSYMFEYFPVLIDLRSQVAKHDSCYLYDPKLLLGIFEHMSSQIELNCE